MRYRLLVLLALTGCDLGLEPPKLEGFTYSGRCLNVVSEVPLNQPDVEFYENHAEALLDAKFGTGTFCTVSASIPAVWVAKADYLPCGLGKCLGTTTAADKQITLTRHGFALLHEYIHAHELLAGRSETLWHWGWDANGYKDMDRQFWTPLVDGTRMTWIQVDP